MGDGVVVDELTEGGRCEAEEGCVVGYARQRC